VKNRVLNSLLTARAGGIYLGKCDGRSFVEICALCPEDFNRRGRDIVNHQHPGEESFARCAGRVIPALEEILGGSSVMCLLRVMPE